MNVYWENQTSGNCRISAINNCFGGPHVDIKKFAQFQREYEALCEIKLDPEFQYVNTNAVFESLLSFILWKLFGHATFTIGQYDFPRFKRQGIIRCMKDAMDLDLCRFFVCNTQHVFCVRQIEDKWVVLDNGVRQTRLEKYESDPSLTLVFPWTMNRCRQGLTEMQKLVRQQFPTATIKNLKRAIIVDLSKREPHHFGDCQIWIGLFFKYLKLLDDSHREIVARYWRFCSVSPLNISNALEHLPLLILFIINFE